MDDSPDTPHGLRAAWSAARERAKSLGRSLPTSHEVALSVLHLDGLHCDPHAAALWCYREGLDLEDA